MSSILVKFLGIFFSTYNKISRFEFLYLFAEGTWFALDDRGFCRWLDRWRTMVGLMPGRMWTHICSWRFLSSYAFGIQHRTSKSVKLQRMVENHQLKKWLYNKYLILKIFFNWKSFRLCYELYHYRKIRFTDFKSGKNLKNW